MRIKKVHLLKTDPIPFTEALIGIKKAEIRKNDRDFGLGDILTLRETLHSAKDMKNGKPLRYTGNQINRVVTNITEGYGLKDGYVALSLGTL